MVETMEAPTKRLREQTTKVKDDLRELGRIGREVSTETIGHAKESAGQLMEKGKEKALVVEDKVQRYVRDKPFRSLGMALGAGALTGMLIGLLIRRR